ncbi:hypothetical protein MKW92_016600 [Papaver armeniacum]|nr:hypothetical protein MKW92_016600 [Papaver armeniacum]
MGRLSWPSEAELDAVKKMVAKISGRGVEEVKVVVSPYRLCPLGAHIDHQGGAVSAMTINKGILLGFVTSENHQKNDVWVILRSGQFQGEVRFRYGSPGPVNCKNGEDHTNNGTTIQEECQWGNYARGASYALQRAGNLLKGIIGYICGSEGLDSSGLSSSAAVGIAYLLAFECANNLTVSPTENIELDRLIENEYLGLKNGILDQSAILLSRYGCLTYMNCKTKEHKLVKSPKLQENQSKEEHREYKILLAFSGLKQALTSNPGYNRRVFECQEAAKALLSASGNSLMEPVLCNVEPEAYEAHKDKLETNLARRAEHYFSENMRVSKGLEAWSSGKIEEFGKLISASGLSSIQNYECGTSEDSRVFGARFSGAGFRAASFVKDEYQKLQPKLANQLTQETAVLICEAGDCAHVI